MIIAIFIYFQAILNKSSLTANKFLRLLSNQNNAKNGVTAKLAVHKDLILKTPSQTSQSRVVEVKQATYGETL